MKVLFLILAMAMAMASETHGQALRLVGYEGELVFVDVRIDPITVRGATLQECQDNFNVARAGRDLYYGIRRGTQECVPLFVYRSPTAPAFSLSPAVTLMPQIPGPPVCLSCPVFDDLSLVKKLYPHDLNEVMDYVNTFDVDKYNQELKALNSRYAKRLENFERKIMALDDYLQDKQ